MAVAAVIVTFQPDDGLHERVLVVAAQVSRVLVVDNGSEAGRLQELRRLQDSRIEILEQHRNLGVAAGQNAGIARVAAAGCDHVLLLDQDSLPEGDMVERLLAAERRLISQGNKVGAVGPVYHDLRQSRAWPFFRLGALGWQAQYCGAADLIPCDFLISSGSLIRTLVVQDVGLMKEGYFLEHVDTEWCLRARARGYQMFGVCNAVMRHALGEGAFPVPFTNRYVASYKPYRHYYLFRNAVLLSKEPHASTGWMLNEVWRLLQRAVFFLAFAPPRRERLSMMLLGLWDGLRGRTGQLSR